MNKLLFYTINFMPYPFVPPPEELESAWVTIPNSHYDPMVGHRLYTDYLEEEIATERLGYDGVLVNEHHQNAYGNMPSPNLIASYIVARTSRIPIGIIGNALNLYNHPLRVAEEVAMLDVISGGRIISGLVRGTGMEYYSYGENPTYAREKFWEAHDLILKAWTEPGPFEWEGEHFHLRYVNPWPRPLQQPHPPIWLPGVGSLETIDEAAKRRYTFMQVYAPRWLLVKALVMYRQIAEEKYEYTPSPYQLGAAIPTYVAETDEQAHREARPAPDLALPQRPPAPRVLRLPAGVDEQEVVQELPRHDHREGDQAPLPAHVRGPDRAGVRHRGLARVRHRAARALPGAVGGRRHRRRGRPVGRDAELDGDEEHADHGRGGHASLPPARREADLGA